MLKQRILEREHQIKAGSLLFLVIVLKESGEFVGCFSLENLGQPEPEMGGWLKVSAQGHRYGQEAAAALKKWADEHIEYNHIVWPCAHENYASRKLAESIGGWIGKEYNKKTVRGDERPYVEYHIPKHKNSISFNS